MPKSSQSIDFNSVSRIKNLIIDSCGFKILYFRDCEALSKEVETKTKKRISVSTLKRFFGLVNTNSKPSQYTLDVLVEYIGYENWESFSSEKNKIVGKDIIWDKIKLQGESISKFTLSSIKNKSGIPFEKTIRREFAEKKVKDFISSSKSIMPFIAPGGYGKSIITARIVEKFWLGSKPLFKNDILYFITGTHIKGLLYKDFDLSKWILSQMGYSGNLNLREYFHKNSKKRKGNIILIIDAIDEISTNAEDLIIFYKHLTNLISSNKEFNWFKIIITLRPASWSLLQSCFFDMPAVKEEWFGVSFDEQGQQGNIPMLEEEEIERIFVLNNQRPEQFQILPFEIKRILYVPYYLQIYLSIYGNFQKNLRNELDLLLFYIDYKIMGGLYGEDKKDLINIILTESLYGLKGFFVEKKAIENNIKEHKKAYQELLSLGILFEESYKSEYGIYVKRIKFTHNNIYELLIALHWVNKYKKLTYQSFKEILEVYKNNEIKLPLLKWLTLFIFNTEDAYVLKKLVLLPLNNTINNDPYTEQNDYYFFLNRNFNYNLKLWKEVLPVITDTKYTPLKGFLENVVDYDYLTIKGDAAYEAYLKTKKSQESQLFGNCLLFLSAFLQDNKEGYSKHIIRINKIGFKKSIHPFPIGRYYACNILYNYTLSLSSEKIIKNLFLTEKLLSRESTLMKDFPCFHCIVIEALCLTEHYEEALKIYEVAKENYPRLKDKYADSGFTQILKLNYCRALIKTGKIKDGAMEFRKIDTLKFLSDSKNYSLIQYYLLKSELHLLNKEIKEARFFANRAIIMAERFNYKFFKNYIKRVIRLN